MKRINHPEFFDGDLPRIEKELGSEEQLVEFLHCFDKAILEIEVDPSGGASLERSLAVYRKKSSIPFVGRHREREQTTG